MPFIQLFGMMLAPFIAMALDRWAASRRRRAVAAGRPVHFRARLGDRRGRLLVDGRLETPVFLERDGRATPVPLGGRVTDTTVAHGTGLNERFQRMVLRYRPPTGGPLPLRLSARDAETVAALLTRAAPLPARSSRWPLTPAPAVLTLALAALIGLCAADVALLGARATADVLSVSRDSGSCHVRWVGGTADVDCAEGTLAGDQVEIIAVPWPFTGEAVDTYDSPDAIAVLLVALAGPGLLGGFVAAPLLASRRVRRARTAPAATESAAVPPARTPESAPQLAAEPAAEAGPTAEELPADQHDLGYRALAAAALHGELHRSGAKVSPPRRKVFPGTRLWSFNAVLGTAAWGVLVLAVSFWFDPRSGHGDWRTYVSGTVAILALARIGWFVVNGWPRCRAVLRALREGEPEPMRYVRLREGSAGGRQVLVLFPEEGGDLARPYYLQRISSFRGSVRRTVAGPPPVGTALVRVVREESEEPVPASLICEIDGVVYLPCREALDARTESTRANPALLALAHSHRRPTSPEL